MRPSHRPTKTGSSDGQEPSEAVEHFVPAHPHSRAEAIERNAIAAKIEFYHREAQRLIGLAAASTVDDAKRQFLALAQQYETLAEHTAERARRQRS